MSLPCGIVLAGGRGERLGLGIPKARALLDGRTLLERAVSTLAGACGELIVVAPDEVDPGPAGARRLIDLPGFEGPLAGLVAGLEACRGARAAVLGVDFPLVTAPLVRALLSRLDGEAGRSLAVVPRPGGVAQPLVSAIATAAAPALRTALERGVRSLRGGLETLAVTWLDDPEIARLPGGEGSFLNVNAPADLDAARRALAAPAGRRA